MTRTIAERRGFSDELRRQADLSRYTDDQLLSTLRRIEIRAINEEPIASVMRRCTRGYVVQLVRNLVLM